jgi:uncharacterized protein (TIGR02611 family)
VDPSKSDQDAVTPTTAEIVDAIAHDDDLADLAPDPSDSPIIAEAKKRRRTVLLLRKAVISLVGVAIMAVGAVMLVAPGPGIIVIVAGLFVLSLEYEWANRRFEQLRDKAVEAAHATAASRWQTALALVSATGIIVGGILWGLNENWPFSSWTLAGSLIGSGVLAMATVIWSIVDLRKHRSRAAASAD